VYIAQSQILRIYTTLGMVCTAAIWCAWLTTAKAAERDVSACEAPLDPREAIHRQPGARAWFLPRQDLPPHERQLRTLYFVPADRPPQLENATRVARESIEQALEFWQSERRRHGFGTRDLQIGRDGSDRVDVEFIAGRHVSQIYENAPGASSASSSWARETEVEISSRFLTGDHDFDQGRSIVVVLIETDEWVARGGVRYPDGGMLWLSRPAFDDWDVVAHEIGHALGLKHDFNSPLFLMSYGPEYGWQRDRVSDGNAGFLRSSRYFAESAFAGTLAWTSVDLVHPPTAQYDSTTEATRMVFRIEDPEGISHVQFLPATGDVHSGAEGAPEVYWAGNFPGGEATAMELDLNFRALPPPDDPLPVWKGGDGIRRIWHQDGIPSQRHRGSEARVDHDVSIQVMDGNGSLTTRTFSLVERSLAELAPHPRPGWDGPLIIAARPGTERNGVDLQSSDELYVDWSVMNSGSVDIDSRFWTILEVDGREQRRWEHADGMQTGQIVWVTDYQVGPLEAGDHQFMLRTDFRGNVDEQDELNNEFARTVTILPRERDYLLIDHLREAEVHSASGPEWTRNRTDYRWDEDAHGWFEPIAGHGTFSRETVVSGGVRRDAVFAHPNWAGPATVGEFTVNNPQSVDGFYGLRDGRGQNGGGDQVGTVRFVIQVVSAGVRTNVLDKSILNQDGWRAFGVDLTAWSSDEVLLRFITDNQNQLVWEDWAAWADVKITTGDAPPPKPLSLDHAAVSAVKSGRTLRIKATTQGGASPVSATLAFRNPGRLSFTEVEMRGDGTEWTATIPASETRDVAGLFYYIEAVDAASNRERSPKRDDPPSVYGVKISEASSKHPESLPRSTYAMVGFPLVPASKQPADVLQPLLGRPTNWRLLEYDPRVGDFRPPQTIRSGVGYWLFSRQANQLKMGGTTVRPDVPRTIHLRKGWNLISNPFPVGIPWRQTWIQASGGKYPVTDSQARTYIPRKYSRYLDQTPDSVNNGAWEHRAFTASTTWEPWEAVAINAMRDCELMATPDATDAARPAPALYPSAAAMDVIPSWEIQLLASSQHTVDSSNFLSASSSSSDGYDYGDVEQPPSPMGGVDLYFPHDDWGESSGDFAEDRRAEIQTQGTWIVAVRSEPDDGVLQLGWSGVESVPSDLHVHLVDDDTDAYIDMRRHRGYDYVAGGRVRHFRVVVGARPVGPRGLPRELVLRPNFPNPFNPETWMPYALPVAGSVEVRIYGVSGSLVRRLDLGVRPPGYYETRDQAAHWDGRNDLGELVASGVYYYEVHAGAERLRRRMQVVR
jgi:hypothetical protein